MDFEAISKLSKDLANASKTMTDKEAKYTVYLFYNIQETRIRMGEQARALSTSGEPHTLLSFFYDQFDSLENQVKRALDKYTDSVPAGIWAKDQLGIGPVIAAGMCAHVGDASRFKTVGNLWSYSGLLEGQKRKVGEKSNWNPDLKRLSWLIGQSFVKVSGNENSLYGRLFKEQKAYYQNLNNTGKYEEKAAIYLNSKKWSKSTHSYRWYTGLWVIDPELNPEIDVVIASNIESKIKDSRKEIKKAIKEAGYDIISNDINLNKANKTKMEELKETKKTEILEEILKSHKLKLRPMLPPAQIQARAERWVAKIFFSHFWEMSLLLKGIQPPKLYAMEHLGHIHEIRPQIHPEFEGKICNWKSIVEIKNSMDL